MKEVFSVQQIRDILLNNSVIAVVGLSPKPERPSNQVAKYLLAAGYRVIPVNPGHRQILGQPCYPDLLSVPGHFDMVNIFRRSEKVLPVVQDAVTKKAKVIWMQEGIFNEEAAKLAKGHGLSVIMDRCIKIDHHQFINISDEG